MLQLLLLKLLHQDVRIQVIQMPKIKPHSVSAGWLLSGDFSQSTNPALNAHDPILLSEPLGLNSSSPHKERPTFRQSRSRSDTSYSVNKWDRQDIRRRPDGHLIAWEIRNEPMGSQTWKAKPEEICVSEAETVHLNTVFLLYLEHQKAFWDISQVVFQCSRLLETVNS